MKIRQLLFGAVALISRKPSAREWLLTCFLQKKRPAIISPGVSL